LKNTNVEITQSSHQSGFEC